MPRDDDSEQSEQRRSTFWKWRRSDAHDWEQLRFQGDRLSESEVLALRSGGECIPSTKAAWYSEHSGALQQQRHAEFEAAALVSARLHSGEFAHATKPKRKR